MGLRNLILGAICALAFLVLVIYAYFPREATAMPHYSGPEHVTPDAKPFPAK
jgi:hypothetical protein